MEHWKKVILSWFTSLKKKPPTSSKDVKVGQIYQIVIFGMAAVRVFWYENDLHRDFMPCLERRLIFGLMPVIRQNEDRLEELMIDLEDLLSSLIRRAMNECSEEMARQDA